MIRNHEYKIDTNKSILNQNYIYIWEEMYQWARKTFGNKNVMNTYNSSIGIFYIHFRNEEDYTTFVLKYGPENV